MSAATRAPVHFNLDDAWETDRLGIETIDARSWGPRLRFSAPKREVEQFAREQMGGLSPFLVYGSGDFHHLTALWLRQRPRLTTVVSFDNHPDWDIRPPHWSCGGWVNRALELPQIARVSVWGCGNFECWWPARIFANHRALRGGRLEVHPWADARDARGRARKGAILRGSWRNEFARFVAGLGEDAEVYVTIDLDCLCAEEAVTNWEGGSFHLDDLVWALDRLDDRIVAGDICGAWSAPSYARRRQRWAADFDHPAVHLPAPAEIKRRNRAALDILLPRLAERDQNDSERDNERPDR